ncbi:MAG TPA: multicopper oxidase domain-containing protein [Terriglobales bacterium]
MSLRLRPLWVGRMLAALLLFLTTIGAVALAADVSDLPRVTTHDNTKPAGELKDRVLTVHLKIKEGAWYPNGDDAPGIPVLTVTEENGPPSIPGPMIRVAEGTRIHVFFRNTKGYPIFVHGLHQRPGDPQDAINIDPGATKELNFIAGAPGTYFYYVTCFAPVPIDALQTTDTVMTGAFIVDGGGAPTDDRVLLIGLWYHWLVPFDFDHGFNEILTVNGKVWPDTTRLSYTVGDTVHWRVINPTVTTHPMHLHGAHFTVESAGNGEKEEMYSEAQRRLAVTESMQPGRTMLISWTPTHAGNWLFHCHLASHFEPEMASATARVMGVASESTHTHHDPSGMSGLVVGIDVHPRPSDVAKDSPPKPQRKLTLTISKNPPMPNTTRRCISVELRDGETVAETVHGSELGPPIILYRGQTTQITVVNKLETPTAIHWHGMELESYYDGVPGYGGDSRQVTPPIQPGGSFDVYMTPPRSGTYIYHTHWHDMQQLTTGLYGALIVLEPGEKYDPEHDRAFVVSTAGRSFFEDTLLVNGHAEPGGTQFRVGERYRLRFINITADDDEVNTSILDGGKPTLWMPLAKDGADLPASYRTTGEARLKFGAGETYDFEFTPRKAGKLTLETKFVDARTVFPIEVVDTPTVSKK